jgi:hypothetical protein
MPRDLHFLTYEKLGLIIILFQELVQVTFGDGKDNENSIDQNGEILAYQILALIHNNQLMMLQLWMLPI